ncbi:hypothetical protein CERZMDRAFT_101240 [Cercospora zeae-maydis SCOH1-5]|uniref:Uncharacterized protein n=1 Tax=Cercospora zeae-maydis SCOH1-5 TaxID=717836 RepID=A0A6A6F5J1_9PEZI|nr:hypothetical protein CERZMDRAFT_101240 [Cercospora zeae-maydis SCOH1-5]
MLRSIHIQIITPGGTDYRSSEEARFVFESPPREQVYDNDLEALENEVKAVVDAGRSPDGSEIIGNKTLATYEENSPTRDLPGIIHGYSKATPTIRVGVLQQPFPPTPWCGRRQPSSVRQSSTNVKYCSTTRQPPIEVRGLQKLPPSLFEYPCGAQDAPLKSFFL